MDRTTNTSGIAALTGTAIGDALGLPVQFLSRDQLRSHPITSMTSFTFPEGTWSDDTSLR